MREVVKAQIVFGVEIEGKVGCARYNNFRVNIIVDKTINLLVFFIHLSAITEQLSGVALKSGCLIGGISVVTLPLVLETRLEHALVMTTW